MILPRKKIKGVCGYLYDGGMQATHGQKPTHSQIGRSLNIPKHGYVPFLCAILSKCSYNHVDAIHIFLVSIMLCRI